MENQANTIWLKAYTPGGFQVGITVGFHDEFPQAVDIDRMVIEAGYLLTAPGLEPGEELETITHVVRRTQHNQDGSQTPCLGLYFENPKLVFCKKAYLNTPDDIATFERLSGLKLAQLPEFPSTALPKRDEKSAAQFIIAAKTPFQVRMTQGTYTDEATGEVKSTPKFAGFHDVSKPTTPASGNAGSQGSAATGSGDGKQSEPVIVWSQDEQVSFWKHWNGDKQIAKGVILDVLGVKALGEFKNSLDRANTLMEMETRPKASGQ